LRTTKIERPATSVTSASPGCRSRVEQPTATQAEPNTRSRSKAKNSSDV
jgi:hypothetical protein